MCVSPCLPKSFDAVGELSVSYRPRGLLTVLELDKRGAVLLSPTFLNLEKCKA